MATPETRQKRTLITKTPEPDIQVVFEDDDGSEIETFIGRGPFGKLAEEIVLALYMIRDYGTGHYRRVPFWAIAAVFITLLYVGNPVDLLPDFLIGIGQIDDVIVITICLLMVRQELYEYRAWKISRHKTNENA